MKESLKKIIERIPDDYVLYPCHHDSTTMKYEKENNSFLQNSELFSKTLIFQFLFFNKNNDFK